MILTELSSIEHDKLRQKQAASLLVDLNKDQLNELKSHVLPYTQIDPAIGLVDTMRPETPGAHCLLNAIQAAIALQS